jgi:cupin fold WbuC family metalloprotein
MKLITNRMIDELITKAEEAQRLRTNYNIHESLSDPVQRLFIATGLSTYFRPHRHLGKTEFAIIIRGRYDVLVFDDEGSVTGRISLGADMGAFALEIPPDVCHTWIPMAEQSVFFEVKQGPYDPEKSLRFAPWAPEEGSSQVKEFQAKLLTAGIGDRFA